MRCTMIGTIMMSGGMMMMDGMTGRCHRCGMPLVDQVSGSQAIGMGSKELNNGGPQKRRRTKMMRINRLVV